MTVTTEQRTMLLNIAVAMLVLFNGWLLYGLLSAPHTETTPSAMAATGDSSAVSMQINVLNGCGVNGVGTKMTSFCRQAGYDVVEMGNYKSFDVEHSIVIDRTGKLQDAVRLAAAVGIARENVVQQFSSDQLVAASVVIGKDFQSLTPWKR